MSEVRVNTISAANGTGPVTLTKQITVKSFEMHDDDETTIIESFNMSSITDGDTGLCSPVFTNNMATVNYFSHGSSGDEGTSFGVADTMRYNAAATTSTYTYRLVNSGNNATDRKNTMSANIGDLA